MYRTIFTFVLLTSFFSTAVQGALSLSLDYLFWKPCSDGFYVTVKQKGDEVTEGGITKSNFKNSMKLLDHDQNSGFRLGGSMCLPYTESELLLQWTYYSPSDSKQMKDKIPNIISITGLNVGKKSGSTETSDKISGEWELDLNTIDAAIAQSWTAIPLIDLKPFVGLKFASIEQQLKIESEGTISPEPLGGPQLVTNIETTNRLTQDFKGLGPTVGIEGRFTLLCGVGVYGSASGSLLYGENDIANKHDLESTRTGGGNIGDDPDRPDIHSKQEDSKHCIRAATSLQAGLFWHMTLFRGCPFIDVKLGWEQQQFFNQNLVDLNPSATHLKTGEEDLNLQGLTLSMALNF